MSTLVEFLNHGSLPYTGRTVELERLLAFWRETPEANGLRGMLLNGEAGIGKSRLIEELLVRVQEQGGLAVHLKLLPESSTSLVPMIARALRSSEMGRRLLRVESEEGIGLVLAALRRLARLRPTLLVIEDLTISIRQRGGEPQKISGGRVRTVLGLMVANQMVERPLTHREFCSIATGEDDPERARNVVYVRLHNLRELLGADAIITETEDAPRLNLDRVRVDLLEVHAHLGKAKRAMRRGLLLRAYTALSKALELARGEVPFPGLYEEFFEAAREDIESSIRDLMMRLSSELLREGDAENAERLLRHGFRAMPDDEEIAELLCDALTQSGQRVEAERVRRASRVESV